MNYGINSQKWPFSLTTLKINDFCLTNITNETLPSLPPSLRSLTFSNARFQLDYFHVNLTKKLLFFEITKCKLRSLPDDSLILASKLYRLRLNDNLITKLPSELPITLENIYISSNRIKSLENTNLVQLKSLKYLYANLNNLTTFPSNLPNNLIILDLSYNQITFLPKNSFRSFRFLEKLFLSNNR